MNQAFRSNRSIDQKQLQPWVQVLPLQALNVGLRYESETQHKLDFITKY